MKQLTEGMKSKSIKKTIKSVKFSIPLYDGGKTYIHSIIVTVEDNDNIIELIKNYQSSLKMARRAFYFRISRRYITEIESLKMVENWYDKELNSFLTENVVH